MAKITVIFGVLLIGLGLIGYVGTSPSAEPADTSSGAAEDTVAAPAAKKSVTALIPAFVGGILLICGVLANQDAMRKHAMHGAASVGLLGCLAGLGRGVMGLGKFFSGDPSLNQRSFLFVWLMAIICGVFVFLCVQSFRAARKRQAVEQES